MSKKRNRRQSFPPVEEKPTPIRPTLGGEGGQVMAHETSPGGFGFFREYGVRETIESIIVAIVLALMFRAYEAEAFIIPTGSMAPTLQGQHMDVICDKCYHKYRVGASEEGSNVAPQNRRYVEYTYCPLCQHQMYMNRRNNANHNSNNGDRILVNKFVYDFSEPKRFDVIVFKNPNNGKQNYIKRLIGLPNEDLLIENGDIYTMTQNPDQTWNRHIVRKPHLKLKTLLQLVDDTDHIPKEMISAGWPERWQEWNHSAPTWDTTRTGEERSFSLKSDGDNTHWLRYRHLIPKSDEWSDLENGDLPERLDGFLGKLINDTYCYNDFQYQNQSTEYSFRTEGAHWVGDLGVECEVDVLSDSGTLALDLVEGGTHFILSINVETGEAVIKCDDPDVEFSSDEAGKSVVELPTAKTKLKGSGSYRIVYANADDKLFLWINNRVTVFDAPYYSRKSNTVIPKYNGPDDPGDAEPIGIGGKGVDLKVTRLKVLRDIYYTSAVDLNTISNEYGFQAKFSYGREQLDALIEQVHEDPTSWSDPNSIQLFLVGKQKKRPMFHLDKDQFLPMGDNSPSSLDGRVWDGPKFVPRDMLIGRAMFIYWPHSLNYPVPFFPNFGEMGFIR